MPETLHTLRCASQTIPYKVKISARARRLRITVSGSGVTVTLPRGVPAREAERFIQANADWVAKQIEKSAKQAKPAALPDDVILWHGEAVQLQRIEEAERKSRIRVDETRGRLMVHLPQGSRLSTREAAEAWMRANARPELEAAVLVEARRMAAHPKAVSVRDQRTRWGSCSSRGNLSFNWRLVMTPPTILRYVVIHELAHLAVPNHSRDFWNLVARYYPDYKKARAWLRKNSAALRGN